MTDNNIMTGKQKEAREGYKKTKLGWIPKDWKIKNIENIAKIKVGRDLKVENFSEESSDIFKYPVYSNTVKNHGLYGYYDFQEYYGESLTIVGRGAGLGTPFSRSGGFGAIGRLLVLFPFEEIDSCFLVYFIELKVNFHIESSGIPQLTGLQVSKYKIAIPPLPEQKKIAQILSTWDKAIDHTQQLIEQLTTRKKGLMQQLLTGKVRLKGFSGEWESLKGGEIFLNHSDKNHDGTLEVLSATQDKGVIPRSEIGINIKYDKSSLKSYKRVDEGDYVISLRSFQGGIEYSNYNGLVSPAYTVLKENRPISKRFYKEYLKTETFINRLNSIIYGIRDGKQISYKEFSTLKILYPPIEEQTAIAKILKSLDEEINTQKQYLESLQQQKKGLMQQLLTGQKRVKTTN